MIHHIAFDEGISAPPLHPMIIGRRSLQYVLVDRGDYGVDAGDDLIVAEPQHMKPERSDVIVAKAVVESALGSEMLVAIDLNHEPGLARIEIGGVAANGVLTAEFHAYALAPQFAPEALLGWGKLPAHCARPLEMLARHVSPAPSASVRACSPLTENPMIRCNPQYLPCLPVLNAYHHAAVMLSDDA